MKKILIIISLALFSFQIFGQMKSLNFDTLAVEITGKVTVKIANYQTGWLKDIDGFKTIIDSLKAKIELINDDIPKEMNFKLTYKIRTNEIIIERNPDLIIYKFNNSVSKSKINECVIIAPEYDIYINFDNLNDLLAVDIQHCVNLASIHKYVSFGNYAKKTDDGIAWTNTCKCENDSVIFIREKSHWNGYKSHLGIMIGAGAGIIGNNLINDFGFSIGRYGTHKGILRTHTYISYNIHYMLNQNNSFQTNGFINLGYRYNFSKRLDNFNWIGCEAGFLINSSGDFFTTPTFRLGTLIDLKPFKLGMLSKPKYNITISPQIYFEDGFNKIYPGLRLGVDFGS